MNYGMPYMGSKNRIAETLISRLPPAEHFYDLFGGGGAMTHCALLSGKYKYVHYNELDPLIFKGFDMFINGKFKTESRWISREDFFKLRDTDPYVAICYSFGNNLKTYLYSRDTEKFKKAVHYSICFNDNSLLFEYVNLNNFKYNSNNIKERRIELQKYFTDLYKHNKLNKAVLEYIVHDETIRGLSSNIASLERLNSFNAGTSNLFLTNANYMDVEIDSDAVIYCDPPYIGTEQYKTKFDHNEFYNWLRTSPSQIYISEYNMPDDFTEIYSKQKQCKMNDKNSKLTVEKLYANKSLQNPLEF